MAVAVSSDQAVAIFDLPSHLPTIKTYKEASGKVACQSCDVSFNDHSDSLHDYGKKCNIECYHMMPHLTTVLNNKFSGPNFYKLRTTYRLSSAVDSCRPKYVVTLT